jgi:hypothetical protein
MTRELKLAIAGRVGRAVKSLGFGGLMFCAGCAYTGLGYGLGPHTIERIVSIGFG